MRLLLILFVASIGILAGMGQIARAADPKAGYRIGDQLSQPKPTAIPESSYKETNWDALIPKGSDPRQAFKGLELGMLRDGDPRAMDALQSLKEAWENAPVESSLRGQRIRIAGFMVPLECKGDLVKEFLLVPYFGACIHVPPPPANQIIHVFPVKPLKNAQTMDAVWVSGVIDLDRSDSHSPLGVSGYMMRGDVITPYTKQ